MIGLLSTSYAFQLKRRSQPKSKAERLTFGLPVSMILSKNGRSFGETTVAVIASFHSYCERIIERSQLELYEILAWHS